MFSALFDLSFDRLITRRLLGVVYAIAAGLIVVTGLAVAIALIVEGGFGIFARIVLVPAAAILPLPLARVIAEAPVVYFRLGEDVRALRDRQAIPTL